jgi:threonine dehydrogenase-like Zn-dependent dehydrogenase
MLATILHAPGDVRFEEVTEPKILRPTDAIIKLSATCICGSDLWPYRGLQPVNGPQHMGHEYCGVVVEVGSAVKTVKPGQFCRGLVRHFRQYLPTLQARLPVLVRAARIHAPVRRFLPHLIDLVLTRKINPGKVFDQVLPIADVAEGYKAMDERGAIKTLLRV